MGCQSVTGRGLGSVESTAKGPKERNFVGVEKLIGPRVVAAGKVTLVSTAGTIDFVRPLPCVAPLSAAALPPTPEKDYVLLVRDETTGTNAVAVTSVNSDATGDATVTANAKTCLKGYTLVGTGTDVIAWVLMKVGD